MKAPKAWIDELPEGERTARIKLIQENAYIIPLTFGRARLVRDEIPGRTYAQEFW